MNETNLISIGSKVIILPKEQEEQTKSGVFMPDFEQEKQYSGIVISVGPGYLVSTGAFIPLQCEEGDTVLYQKQLGRELEHNDKLYIVMEERDLLSIIRKTE